jgi:hypothetical protein
MPRDLVSFPEVETDDLLRTLTIGRQRMLSNWVKAACPQPFGVCIHLGVALAPHSATAIRYLLAALPVPGSAIKDIWDFNDAPETTLADVVGVYDRAIAARRAELGG